MCFSGQVAISLTTVLINQTLPNKNVFVFPSGTQALKAAGSGYSMAGRLGGRFGNQASAAASAAPKSPGRVSAPPGATAAAAMAALRVKTPKSPQSVGSASLTAGGGGDRQEARTRGKKTAADSGVGGTCVVS